MKVVYFHRKKRDVNFSIESLFRRVREALPDTIHWKVKEMKYFSEGFFKRLYITFEAMFSQGDVNHVTGDINFISLLLRKKRTVLTIHDLGLLNHPNKLARTILKWFWVVLPVKSSGVVTTVSEATKRELLKVVSKPADAIRVVYVPISPLYSFHPKVFNSNEPVILQVGTKANKNVIMLVRALKGIPCTLRIVGAVPPDLAAELELSQVRFESFQNLSDEELVAQYTSADMLAFVSTLEGFGMPIVEANAVGRPVITSSVFSMPEIAGNAAHLVDPLDVNSIRAGILKVINDVQYREMLVRNGLENVKRFDVRIIAAQYAAIYQHCMEAKAGS